MTAQVVLQKLLNFRFSCKALRARLDTVEDVAQTLKIRLCGRTFERKTKEDFGSVAANTQHACINSNNKRPFLFLFSGTATTIDIR